MTETISKGFMALVSDGDEDIDSVRGSRQAPLELIICIESADDFVVRFRQ